MREHDLGIRRTVDGAQRGNQRGPHTRSLTPVAGMLGALVMSTLGCSCGANQNVAAGEHGASGAAATLVPFESDGAFRDYLASLQHASSSRGWGLGDDSEGEYEAAPSIQSAPPPPASAPSAAATGGSVPMRRGGAPAHARAPSERPSAEPRARVADPATAERASDESITNTQEVGVDEGDIVKAHGDHLVVLRRGRLFSVRLVGGHLAPVSVIDAPPPGVSGGWYDEMLISDDTVVVVGYNYQSSGTELAVFHIDDAGVLTRQGVFYLRSGDYYSSRNYASRLIGSTLVFYMPVSLAGGHAPLPAVRHDNSSWDELVVGQRIYRPVTPNDATPTMHTVVRCNLEGAPNVRCVADGIIGPSSRSFYVSQNAVYVWTSTGGSRTPSHGYVANQNQNQNANAPQAPIPDALVYRIPLDGGVPGAVRAYGQPIDQFSFDESEGQLRMMVRAEGGSDSMWRPEVSGGDVAFVNIPLASMTTQVSTVPVQTYVPLPRVQQGTLHERFVGDYLVYGGESWNRGWGQPAMPSEVIMHPVRGGVTQRIPVAHDVERIEQLGDAALVVGSAGPNVVLTAISAHGAAVPVGTHMIPQAAQSESRSHGFFFRPDDGQNGILGLPTSVSGASESASVQFVRVEDFRFRPVGALHSRSNHVEDQCRASCTDWYGNARPIFYRGRIFALLGYELVEGMEREGQLVELDRTNYFAAPGVTLR